MSKHIFIYALIFIIVQIVIIFDLLNKRNEVVQPIIDQPELTNLDGLFNDLDTLEYKSDTIKLYYEKEISNYHILPRSERIKLFSDRINR